MDSFPSIIEFLNQIIKEKHGSQLSEEMMEQMRQDLLPRLHKWILLKAMTEIGQTHPDKLDGLTKLAEGTTPAETVISYIKENIVDFDAFLTQTLVTFRQTYQEG